MIENLQESRGIQRHDAAHECGEREDHRGDVDGKSSVVEEGIEHDADALPTVDNAETVERNDEKQLWGFLVDPRQGLSVRRR